MLLFEKRKLNAAAANTDIEEAAIALAQSTGYDLYLCKLLCMRGIFDKAAAEAFLKPSVSQLHDPFLFSQMHLATERIKHAGENGENICIYGDYDVDGMCAVSILYSYLRSEGYNVGYYVPSRKSEGYGMNSDAIEKLHDMGVNLIISVDNGITAHKEVALAQRLGMDVIITDHHTLSDIAPSCTAVICHTCNDETYPNHDLCGAGTALKLVHALGGEDAMKAYITYAGLATVADVVSLTGENRALVALALDAVNSDNCPIGIKALIDVSSPNRKAPVNERDFAFGLAPRLNSAGRIKNASLGIELLCAQDGERAKTIAQELDALNSRRRADEEDILSEAEAQISSLNLTDTRILVLKSENWNSGIVGIAAARLAEKYYRPTILLCETDGVLTGSARSTPEIDIYDAMFKFADMYIKFGGHKFAAGVTMRSDSFEAFRDAVNEYIINTYPVKAFIPKVYYDCEAELYELTPALAELTEKLAPFGEGNLRPLFLTKGVVFPKLSRIGQDLTHINGKVASGSAVLDMVSFGKGYMFDALINSQECDIAFSPSISDWGGSRRLQLKIQEFLPSHISDYEHCFDKHSELFMSSFYKNISSASAPTPQKIRTCNTAFIKSALTSSYDGTMVLCMDKAAAIKIASICDNSCIADFAFGTPSYSVQPFNTVLFAPVLDKLHDIKDYYRVIVCGCVSDGQLNAICHMFSSADIFVTELRESSEAREFISACERTNMGQIYTKLIAQIKNQSASTAFREAVCASISEQVQKSLAICEFALDCFVELGLLFVDKNDRIAANNNGVKVELSSSPLYMSVKSYMCTTKFSIK